MGRFLRFLRAVRIAVPHVVKTIKKIKAGIEEVAIQLVLLALALYGLYRFVVP